MEISFYGAARGVTGSRHLLKVNGKQILLDCGLFQGKRELSNDLNNFFAFDPKKIDAVILSHAHIDHSGNLPTLAKNGFNGPVYSTFATRDLCNYMLSDSAFIQEREVEQMIKHGKKPVDPLYTMEDAESVLSMFHGVGYYQPFEVCEGVICQFRDAGHILGSATVHLTIDDKETGKKITLGFTGDLGRKGLPLLRNPDPMLPTQYYLTECTYGNRFHESLTEVAGKLKTIINETAQRGGKIIIPAFSLERTQEIVYHLNLLWQAKEIPELPIYVDSPLAGNVTEVFRAHPECLDKETYANFIEKNIDPFGFGRLIYTRSVEESKKLNDSKMPMIIISASGMCEHGRILHHLKNNIEDERTSILIVGYQAEETLGRKLIEGRESVNIFGDSYTVKAKVHVLDAFSAHADRSDLLDYMSQIEDLKKIFLVHGEDEQTTVFQKILKEEGYPESIIPTPGETYTLLGDGKLELKEKIDIEVFERMQRDSEMRKAEKAMRAED